MDILNQSKKEINEMSLFEKIDALNYAKLTYLIRGINFPPKEDIEDIEDIDKNKEKEVNNKNKNDKKGKKRFKVEFTHDNIRKRIKEAYNRG